MAAGCSLVRIAETSDNQVIWVAARDNDKVLAFGTHMLVSNPNAALVGYANTRGVAPVGQLFHNPQLLAVVDSNLFATPEIGT